LLIIVEACKQAVMTRRPPEPEPQPEGSEDTVFLVLYDVARMFRRDFHRRARAHGTTRAQWQVLAALARREGIRQIQLADVLEIEPITLVRLLDRLEEAGLVERRTDPTDRRARTLHLTEAATPVIAEIRAVGLRSRAIGLSGLSADEKTQLLGLLQRIRMNFAERGGPADQTPALEDNGKGVSHG
jgi:MarR family transcriptional regulator for hemolysin